MATPGQGYAYSGSSFKKIKEPGFWAATGTTLKPVKKAWAYKTSPAGWVQFYPHPKPPPTKPPPGGGGGGTPTTHTTTVRASHVISRFTWRISSSRHVIKQTGTLTAGPSGFVGVIAGHRVFLAAGKSYSFNIGTSLRSVSISGAKGLYTSLTIRYTYR